MPTKSLWDAHYKSNYLPWDLGHCDDELKYFIDKYRSTTHASALDIGCGSGNDAIWLFNQGFKVVGIDISDNAIKLAKDTAAHHHAMIDFLVGDFLEESLILPKFDIIYDRAVLSTLTSHHDKEKFIKAVHAHCHKTSFWVNVVISSNHIEALARDVEFSTELSMSLSQLVTLIEPLFEMIEVRQTSFPFVDKEKKVSTFYAWASISRPR